MIFIIIDKNVRGGCITFWNIRVKRCRNLEEVVRGSCGGVSQIEGQIEKVVSGNLYNELLMRSGSF